MKDKDKNFEILGDEALEARVVAWVLGEASEFETDELLRLCGERPELEVFRRRIAAVHGLAGEAMKNLPVDWKLSETKRTKVLSVAGVRPADDETRRERTSRHAARRMLWGIAACVVLTVAVAGLLVPQVLRAKKSATPARASSERMVNLSKMSEIPPEVLHGTPRTVRLDQGAPASRRSRSLPAQEAPAADQGAPASRRSRNPSSRSAGVPPVAEPTADPLRADKEINLSSRSLAFSVKPKPAKPKAAPSSASAAKIIAANTNVPIEVPTIATRFMPDDLGLADDEFWDGDDFGGDGSGGGGGATDARLREKQVVIGGHVRKPGPVSHQEGMTLGEVVDSADGADEFGAVNRLEVYRDGKRRMIDLRSDEGRAFKLKSGDAVNVPQKNFFGNGGGSAVAGKSPADPAGGGLGIAASDKSDRSDGSDKSDGFDRSERLALTPGASGMPAGAAEKQAENSDLVPTLADVPLIGRLFNGKKKEKGLAVDVEDRLPGLGGEAAKDGVSDNDGDGFSTVHGGTIGSGVSRTNTDFINPGNKTTIPGTDVSSIITGGNRSGDAAITRNSIDAILNNPNRTAESNKRLSGRQTADGRGQGRAEIGIVREFVYPGEYEPPELPNQLGSKANADKDGVASLESKGSATKNHFWSGAYDRKNETARGRKVVVLDEAQKARMEMEGWLTGDAPIDKSKGDDLMVGGALNANTKDKKAWSDALKKEDVKDSEKRMAREVAFETRNVGVELVEANKELEQSRELLDQMRMKYRAERIQLELPRNPVTVHEEAKIAKKPGFLSFDRRYESKSVVQVNPKTEDLTVFGRGYAGGGRQAQQFFGTQFDVIKSRKTLGRVVDKLGLEKRWGVTKEQALERLKGSVETHDVEGTELIEIRAKDRDAGLSTDIAAEVTKAYCDRRAELEGDRARKASEMLDDALREQEERVEEKRKVLNMIVETKGIPYMGRESVFGGSSFATDEDAEARSASMGYGQLEQEKVQLDSQIKTLHSYTNDQLIEFAAGLNLPENTVKHIKPESDRAKTQLIALKASGLADEHPRVRAQKEIVEDYCKQLDEGVAALRDVLQVQLDLTRERLARMEALKKDRKEDLVKRSIDTNDLVEARKEFERERNKLVEMQAEIKARQIRSPEAKREFARQLEMKRKEKAEARRREAAHALDLMAETSAAKEPYSTFSLHVSDASFRVALAALERGERPKPEAVRPEEFYNAFDYGDAAPTADEPVACAVEQCRHPVLPRRNLVRVAVNTAAAGRGAGQPLNLTVLLDNSGSMEREDRRAALHEAIRQLASLIGPNDVVSVIGFARTPRLLADRLDGTRARKDLAGIVGRTPSEGGTNLEAALGLADEVAQRQFAAEAQNRIVLLTDGAANLGNANPESLARRIESLRLRGIAFDAAGFGIAGMNDEMLERLTRDGNGRYYVVDRVEDAGPGFAAKLAGAFRPAAENVKVQVRFNPQRVGRYRLIGFEKHRLKKEDFRDDTVDAAEMAAEEAGVAIYQVELLPGGEGEIGEVSVRFREMAKDRMVERNWTLTYDESAPAFDQAAPSMQLAGLSAILADVLRDGPLAPLVDWHDLAPVVTRVHAEFAGNKKVGELVRMIGKVR